MFAIILIVFSYEIIIQQYFIDIFQFHFANHCSDIPNIIASGLPAPKKITPGGGLLSHVAFLANEPALCEVSNSTFDAIPAVNFAANNVSKLQVRDFVVSVKQSFVHICCSVFFLRAVHLIVD